MSVCRYSAVRLSRRKKDLRNRTPEIDAQLPAEEREAIRIVVETHGDPLQEWAVRRRLYLRIYLCIAYAAIADNLPPVAIVFSCPPNVTKAPATASELFVAMKSFEGTRSIIALNAKLQ
jgi:hypothetical protein